MPGALIANVAVEMNVGFSAHFRVSGRRRKFQSESANPRHLPPLRVPLHGKPRSFLRACIFRHSGDNKMSTAYNGDISIVINPLSHVDRMALVLASRLVKHEQRAELSTRFSQRTPVYSLRSFYGNNSPFSDYT